MEADGLSKIALELSEGSWEISEEMDSVSLPATLRSLHFFYFENVNACQTLLWLF
jgi:hypothetical protein